MLEEHRKSLIGLILSFVNFLILQKPQRQSGKKHQLYQCFIELKEMLLIQKKNVVFEINSLVENDEIKCDRDGLRQVFLNCLLNALGCN